MWECFCWVRDKEGHISTYFLAHDPFPTSPLFPNITLRAPYLILTSSAVLLLVKSMEHKKKRRGSSQNSTKMASVLVSTPKTSLQPYSPSPNISPFWFFLQQHYMIHPEINFILYVSTFHPEIILELHVVHKYLTTVSRMELPLENTGNPELWWMAVTTKCMVKVRLTLEVL